LFLSGQDFVQSVKKIIKIIFHLSRLQFQSAWLRALAHGAPLFVSFKS